MAMRMALRISIRAAISSPSAVMKMSRCAVLDMFCNRLTPSRADVARMTPALVANCSVRLRIACGFLVDGVTRNDVGTSSGFFSPSASMAGLLAKIRLYSVMDSSLLT